MQWSYTVDKLLSLVGRGRVDVSCATEIARAVLRDGVDNEAARKLGSLGAFGSSASNAERDLRRWLSNLFGLRLQPYTVYLDMKVHGVRSARVPVSVLLPHELFHALATADCELVFNSVMYGNLQPQDIERFWQHVKAAANKLLAELCAWSMRWALAGRAPEKGFYDEAFPSNSWRSKMAGKPLAKGHKACYFATKSDLKARKEIHNFQRWYSCTLMCDLCFAEKPAKRGRPAMNFKDTSASAPYTHTMLDHKTYMATHSQVSDWSAVEGWTLETNGFDFMHNCFLGTAKDFIASGLRVLLQKGVWGDNSKTNVDEVLASVTAEIQSTCKRHGCLGHIVCSKCVFYCHPGIPGQGNAAQFSQGKASQGLVFQKQIAASAKILRNWGPGTKPPLSRRWSGGLR
ncbi:unnamed protein product [Effrenium voratum]|nr:unnamed protein product [Effrenium voratum]